MPSTTDQQQVDIFAPEQQQKHFAELCNALYERELASLAKKSTNNIGLLKRRLAGLSHHIKNAAESLLSHHAPIEVDVHNGSWQAKQPSKCSASRHDPSKTSDWYHSYARMGLPVPVYLNDLGIQTVELDSIDRIDSEQGKIHVNKHGWFLLDGEQIPPDTSSNSKLEKRLLLPNKANIIAACCGHSWNHKGKISPRALDLREILLSTTINWKNFR